MNKKIITIFLCVGLLLNTVWAEENLNVLPETIDGFPPHEMMHQYLCGQIAQQFKNWQGKYERRKTTDQITEYQKRLRGKFLEAIGGLPEKTPLNPQITGVVKRDGYHVEKIIFESRPKFFVTGLLFLPQSEKYKPPYPGILIPCGHASIGKEAESYQNMAALLALNGMAGFVFDPVGQGERVQDLNETYGATWGTKAHNMIGLGSILLGQNTARFIIWDGMRAIDYLQSRPDVAPKRIGCTGNSGGGTQTAYLMSLDDRIIAAAPSCYITSMYERIINFHIPDAEQVIFGQFAFGMGQADYLMMRAPVPILVCSATNDFFDIKGTWDSFRYSKRLYTRLGYAERIDIVENDAKHGFGKPLHEAAARWMARWLQNDYRPIKEPQIKALNKEETWCTPQGQVMKMAGARSTFDINRDFEKQLTENRKRLWKTKKHDELLQEVRKLAGIRKLEELPQPTTEKIGTIERDGYTIEKIILKPEQGIYLPALLFVPGKSDGAVLYLNEKGKSADANTDGEIEQLVKNGNVVLCVDIRGAGETQHIGWTSTEGYFGKNGHEALRAYLLGRNYVAMRTEDILVCARWLIENKSAGKAVQINLVSKGNSGVPALHAAALRPQLFKSVKITGSLISWSNIIKTGHSYNQPVNMVHGALTTYDLNNLAEVLGDKLTIENPLDALGRPVENK